MIKLDVNNGVYTMDMWICLDETGPVFSWHCAYLEQRDRKNRMGLEKNTMTCQMKKEIGSKMKESSQRQIGE